MKIERDIKLDFKDVLIKPRPSFIKSRKNVCLTRVYQYKYSNHVTTECPIIPANMDGVGTFSMARAMHPYRINVALRKHYSQDEFNTFHTQCFHAPSQWYSFGITSEDLQKLDNMSSYVERICLDVANGYIDHFAEVVKSLRKKYPNKVIMAGNVATPDLVKKLIKAGADVVKIGIGPGSACTTRKMTGCGYPQLSAIIACAKMAHKMGAMICADGGCQHPGDVAKALAAGADFVMLGGMLAGHREGEYSNHVFENGEHLVKFYGMSSDTAQNLHNGGKRNYRASEGKTVTLKYRGHIEPTIEEILGGLRSAMTYINAHSIEEISDKAIFIRVNQQLNPMFGDQ